MNKIPENAVYKQTLTHYIDGKPEHTYYFYYDEHDNMILMIKPPYEPFRYFYEYNNYGQVIAISRDDSFQFNYEYNADKTLSKEICYYKGKLFYFNIYRYNGNNNPYKICNILYDTGLNHYCKLYYDNNDRLSIEKTLDKKEIFRIKYFSYDDFGNLIKKEVDEKRRSIIYHEIYTYNSDNKLIQTTRYDNNKLSYIDKFTYEFYK